MLTGFKDGAFFLFQEKLFVANGVVAQWLYGSDPEVERTAIGTALSFDSPSLLKAALQAGENPDSDCEWGTYVKRVTPVESAIASESYVALEICCKTEQKERKQKFLYAVKES